MAWLRSAMQKAVDKKLLDRGRSPFGAIVRSHTGYIGRPGAKKLLDRNAARNIKSYKEAVRSLEKVSVSSKGEERVQLLEKWLVSLGETERLKTGSAENVEKTLEEPHTSSDKNDSTGKSDVVLYSDPDLGISPVNFRDVFLHSQALEGMIMSMILEAPNEEEILLLHKIFGLCLAGGEEVHDAIVKRILDLSKAFSVYDEEVLAKRRELLQFAQGAISGLKVNADILRIDSEVSEIQKKLKKTQQKEFLIESDGSSSDATSDATLEVIKQSVAPIQLCCRLESLLLKKRLSHIGNTPEAHALIVDKLKVLSESLLSSASKTEKRISDHRQQKEEALHFRVAKTSEVSQIEKDLGAEISMLEKQRDELEAELNKVKNSLAIANARLQNAKEEREQFDDANNELLVHFKSKEDELSKAIVSYRAEADTCGAFVEFLEATWVFQSSFMEQKDKKVNDELDNHEEYFVNMTRSLLSAYKDALGPAITDLKNHMKNLERYEKPVDPDEEFLQDIEQRNAEEHAYVAAETKITTIFEAAESVKENFYHSIDNVSRKGVQPVKELCEAIEKIKSDFESLSRPTLKNDKLTKAEKIKESPKKSASPSSKRVLAVDLKSIFTHKLVARSPKKKPYIPLGGSAENSPNLNDDPKPVEAEKEEVQVREDDKSSRSDEDVSNPAVENENKNIENATVQVREDEKSSPPVEEVSNLAVEKNKNIENATVQMKEDEKSSHPDEEVSNLAIENKKKNNENSTVDVGGNVDKKKTDEGELLQPSASVKENSSSVDKGLLNMDLEKESRELSTVEHGGNMDERQESKMSKPSTSEDTKSVEPSKELASLASLKVVVNPEPPKHEQEKTSQVSTSNGEKLLDRDNEMPKLASEGTEVGGNTKTHNAKQRKPSESSTSESDKLSDSDEEQEDEEDWHSTESDTSIKLRDHGINMMLGFPE